MFTNPPKKNFPYIFGICDCPTLNAGIQWLTKKITGKIFILQLEKMQIQYD
jgi:hypothetical protein